MEDCIEEYQAEYDRLGHDDDCEGKCGHQCLCGCGTTITCPGGDICRLRIQRLCGWEETRAVRLWMKMGLCVCEFVVKNREPFQIGPPLSDRQYTKGIGNWSARRRRKLVRCPCGAYYDNDTVRALGLFSESEWKRQGFPFFKNGVRHYLPNAKKRAAFSNLPHVRIAPAPVARIWRPFYSPQSRRFEKGLASVDLFSADQVDFEQFVLSDKLAVALMDGDSTVLKLIQLYQPLEKQGRRRSKWTPQEALREYLEQTGFSKPLPK